MPIPAKNGDKMHYPHSRRRALSTLGRNADDFTSKLTAALNHYALGTPKQKRAAATVRSAVIGRRFDDHFPLANIRVRTFLTERLIDQFHELYRHHRFAPEVRTFLFTATFDDGIVSERSPVIPLARIRRKVRRLLATLKLDAVCILQIDMLASPLPGDSERLLLVHVHALVWTRNRHFKPRKTGRDLSGTRALRNRTGARSIDFTSRARSARQWRGWTPPLPDEDQAPSSMAHLAYYLLKFTVSAKRRRRGAKTGRIRLRPDSRRVRQRGILRQAELWSQLELGDVLFGVGKGEAIARAVRREFTVWRRLQRVGGVSADALGMAWKTLFAARPEWGFEPSRFG
jgi:hypothetical protein